MRTTTALSCLLLAVLAPVLRGQGVYYDWPDIGPGGAGVASAGDIDGDGISDFLIGDGGGFTSPGPGHVGTVRIFSGADGTLIRGVQANGVDDGFGLHVLSLGDVDQDGRPDFAVGAPSTLPLAPLISYVRAFSGASGAQLWQVDSPSTTFQLGVAMAIVGDLDSDGIRDLAIGATTVGVTGAPGTPGLVLLVSGGTGAVLRTIQNVPGSTSDFGSAVADADDFDGDSVGDVFVGDPAYLAGLSGRVTLHSGSNGAVLQTFAGPPNAYKFGASLANVGDVDGDLVADVVIGAPFEYPIIPGVSFYSGRVRLYSAASAAVLLTLDPPILNDIYYGIQVAACRDVDGDGLRDLMIAEGEYHFGCCAVGTADLTVRSSASGQELFRDRGHSLPFAVVADRDGDGLDDYLLSVIVSSSSSGISTARGSSCRACMHPSTSLRRSALPS